MTVQAQTAGEGTNETGANANASGTDPAGKTPPAGSGSAEKTSTKADAGGKTGDAGTKDAGKVDAKTDAGKVEKKTHSITSPDDESDIPDDAELVQLTPKALKARLNRHTRRELRERFGTDDLEAIARDMKELQELRAEKEEARKAQLSKEQRLEEEKKEAERRAKEAERRAKALEDERDIATVDAKITKLASAHIDASFLEDGDLREGLFNKLRVHLKKETGGDAGKITDKMIGDFWRKLATENPKFAKATETVVEVKVDSGSKAKAPEGSKPASGQGATKTAKPGQANTMTRHEIAQTYGLRW